MKKNIILPLCALLCSVSLLTTQANAGTSRASQTTVTVASVLAARTYPDTAPSTPKYCQGGRFQPCVCASDVTKVVQYRPSVKECNGNAAIILSGRYANSFSVVVRDTENRDRWPATGANGCTPAQVNKGEGRCSVFKVQGKRHAFLASTGGTATVNCLGASGYSPLFRNVVRMTIKVNAVAGGGAPVDRLCLAGPTNPLN